PPPCCGGTRPGGQGVHTHIWGVDPPPAFDESVAVVNKTVAVERGRSGGAVPTPVSAVTETSGPMPFPLAELGVDDDDDDDSAVVDESAVRLRPRPYSPTARVDAVPDVVEDSPAEALGPRGRGTRTTVLYGADELDGSASMLEAVTNRVDADAKVTSAGLGGPPPPPKSSSPELEGSTAVRATGAAIERSAVGPRRARERVSGSVDSRRSSRSSSSEQTDVARGGRSGDRRLARESIDDERPRRRAWPWVAGLGLVAGVAVVFGVPSIRARVLEVAGQLAGGERFDPESLSELSQARTAMASLDPVAVGKAEAALQGRLDGGEVPPSGVAAMKLAQVELLATRAIEAQLLRSLGDEPAVAGPDDVERATRILGSVVVDDVEDREHMRRVRARLRLAQGRPAAEILPLLPEGDDGSLRSLVAAASLWRDPEAPVPQGVIAAFEAMSERDVLAELTLAVGYLRAGDEAKALAGAQRVLEAVSGQPTALAVAQRAGGILVGDPADASVGSGSGDGSGTEAATPSTGTGGATEDGSDDADPSTGDAGTEDAGASSTKPAAPKAESIDSLIGRGCDEVESGDVAAGLELLRKAKARRPRDLDVLLCTGIGHAKQGKTSTALSDFEAILQRSPSFAPALRQAANAADKLGQTDKAVRYYRKLLGQRPGDPKAIAYVEEHG
ncbi:MAG: tetratricopeptide repeat protein, partial [Nannocystaceae bacterium]